MFVCALVADRASGQEVGGLEHDPPSCVRAGQYPILTARAHSNEALDQLQTTRAYFRSDQYPSFYWVEMQPSGRDPHELLAILPTPSSETTAILYYLEGVDITFDAFRSLEYRTQVTPQCDARDMTGLLPGQDPGIVVGATEGGASALPPGFEKIGIAGAVTAAGVSTGLGGGAGAGAAIAVGAGVAAGVAGTVVATQAGGNSEPGAPDSGSPGSDPPAGVGTTPPSPVPGPTPPAPGPTTPVNVTACMETIPASLVIEKGDSVTFDAACSRPAGSDLTFSWDFGGVSPPKQARRVSLRYPGVGNFAVTLTALHPSGDQDSIERMVTVTVPPPPPPPPPTACFTANHLNACRLQFHAGCSQNVVVGTTYEWVVDPDGIAGGPFFSSPAPAYVKDFGTCSGETITATVTLTGSNGTDSVTQQVVLPSNLRTADEGGRRRLTTSFVSELIDSSRQPSSVGRIVVNDTISIVTSSAGAFQHTLDGAAGKNKVMAMVVESSGRELWWRFHFAASEHFRAGSIAVQHGQVVRQDGRSVVFRMSGAPNERVQFSYALDP